MSQRDTQRARLYAADDVIEKFATPLPTVKDVERFVKKVMSSKRVQTAYPKACRGWLLPKVKDGRGCLHARGGERGIVIPLWARKSNVVIHELAHTISSRQFGGHIAGHGWEFCSVYLRLVLYFMGREAHDEMKASFKATRVRFTAPRKGRKLSPEQRAAAIARLSVYNGTAATEQPFWNEM